MAEFASNLPIFVINTLGSEYVPDEPKMEGSLDVYSVGTDGTASLSQTGAQRSRHAHGYALCTHRAP